MKQQTTAPSILTANTYFWKPCSNANSRRRNEERKLNEVEQFFSSIGFETTNTGSRVIAKKDNLEAEFSYSESCKNVYKSLQIIKDGKKSNITAIKKYLA